MSNHLAVGDMTHPRSLGVAVISHWESYWKTINKTGIGGQVLWDNVPERAVMEDFLRFRDYMDRSLPLLDLGCGNGRQTRCLAKYFNRVIGVDISPSAIVLAIKETVHERNVEYWVFDAVNTQDAKSLHNEFGDLNVYMRGVLHVIQEDQRRNFINSHLILLGEIGTLY